MIFNTQAAFMLCLTFHIENFIKADVSVMIFYKIISKMAAKLAEVAQRSFMKTAQVI